MRTQANRFLRSTLMFGIPGIVLFMMGEPFTVGLGVGLMFFSMIYLLKLVWELVTGTPDEARAIEAMKVLPYKHFFDGSGIGIDPQTQQIHLYMKPTYKVYPFSDVRKWEVSSVTGGVIVGGGLAGAAGTLSQGMKAAKESGLFVYVKDISIPRWRVAFNRRKEDKEHHMWMEILRQSINND